MSEPLVSIVVPTLNQGSFIEQTLLSIMGQGWPRLEVIVIDGGSTDQTAAVVRSFGSAITHFVSEPDRGQAEAINKGMRLAKGDVLAWLNSDDYYLPGAIAHAVRKLADVREPRLVYGSCLLVWEGTEKARLAQARVPFDREALTTCDYIYQPSAFWTRELWERTGELNDALHFVMDWDWWLRASQNGEFIPTPQPLSYYRFHDAHKSSGGSPKRRQEIVQLVERYAAKDWSEIFRKVSQRVDGLAKSFKRCEGRPYFFLHRLRHFDLFAKYGDKVDTAFWQLHV
jgi:glycosyltransferase involved in cell wall biosynthesis